MQKWDYLVVHEIGIVIREYLGDKGPWKDKKAMLVDLGEKGWELIHITDGMAGDNPMTIFYFKRLKSPGVAPVHPCRVPGRAFPASDDYTQADPRDETAIAATAGERSIDAP